MTEKADDAPPGHGASRQSWRFLALYALASGGGSAAYTPFLTLLLPGRISAEWGDRGVEMLSYIAFAGAIAASLSNIAAGWVSDRTGMRRGWIVLGLAASSVLLVSMPLATSFPALLAMIVAWQISLNFMLNPLLAWAGDCIPDEQKGTLGGLLSLSPAFGALAGAVITLPGLAGPETRLLLVAGLVAAAILPVVLFGRPRPMPELAPRRPERALEPLPRTALVTRMWLARLLVQVAEAALFAFLLIWFRTIDASVTDNFVARLFTFVLFVSVPVALVVGRWSDRQGKPLVPLIATAAGGAFGLVAIGFAETTTMAVVGYVVFGVLVGVFLALHASQTLRVLPRPETRGRDLGIFNLTNTVPSLIMPWLTLALIPTVGFRGLFFILAVFSAGACILLATMRGRGRMATDSERAA